MIFTLRACTEVILSSTWMATRSFSPMPRKERSGEETLTGIGIVHLDTASSTAARMIINYHKFKNWHILYFADQELAIQVRLETSRWA